MGCRSCVPSIIIHIDPYEQTHPLDDGVSRMLPYVLGCKPAGIPVRCTILHMPTVPPRDSNRPLYPYFVVTHTERGPVLSVRPSQCFPAGFHRTVIQS